MKSIYNIIFSSILMLNAQTVEQTKKQLLNTGATQEQVKNMVRNQGYTDNKIEAEAQALGIEKDGIAKDENFQSVGEQKVRINEETEEIIDKDEDQIEEIVTGKIDDSLEHFGYKIFMGDPDAFQASTFGAVDPNYNIGPEDRIIVMLWGESQFRQEFVIDREGYVFVPEVGQIFVNGLNLEALEKKFFQILSKVYSTLKPATGKPTTFMDISLGNLRPLRIIVLGEVGQPGAYSVSPSTSLSSSLYYFRGPTIRGSLRDIRLLRKGKQVGVIDFYDYLLSGNTPSDPRLQLDDVVFVPPRGKTVTIRGDINRQGIYELKETEGLKDLLQIAGDLSVTAYMDRTQISRIVPIDDRSELGMDRMVIDIDLNDAIADKNDTELHDGDEVLIFSIDDYHKNYVTLFSSSVMRPGRYQLVQDMRVIDLLDAADGLLSNAYMNMAHIKRTKDDLTTELITINLKNALDGDLENNIKLQFLDELIVYNKNNLTNSFTNVYINGPVKYSGVYDLEKNKKLSDLIIAAGGFNVNVSKVKITIARVNPNSFNPDIYNLPSKSSKNKYFQISQLENIENVINKFPLRPNDIVNIYSDPKDQLPKMVNISGAIHFPGEYPIISSKEKVTDIIYRAGGLLPEAYPMASTIIRNGQRIRLSFAEIIKNPNSKDNFTIIANDSINIMVKPNIVKIIGEVNNPGIFKFYNNKRLRDYINIAGGFTVNAEPREIWLTYPNGTSHKLKRFFSDPRVYDGSVITVGREKESEPIDKTEFAKELASIFADFLNIYISLTLLARTAESI